ncbi:MAG TPA: PRC-barrel domain-containing protein [Aestuariivirgaceae bacterium]|nr:PRC-barrel domain-containing protein [Aestuariivirgaceae bacterium]
MKSFAHEIAGMPVHASDGDIGTIKDVVFDPQSWTVRYLEVSTGWLLGRDVLIPVDKVKSIEAPEGAVTFDLTKEEIEKSPPAEPARPVDRSYEGRLMGYYGLSPYWTAPPEASQASPAPELLFAGDIDGYELDAQGERVGTVRDVLVDLDTWRITSLMADLGGLFTRDSATIGTAPVTGIDVTNRIVHVSMPKETVDRNHRTGIDDLPYVFPYVPPIA